MTAKKQGWFMYELVAFIPPDHQHISTYSCPNCKTETHHLQHGGTTDLVLECPSCEHMRRVIEVDGCFQPTEKPL